MVLYHKILISLEFCSSNRFFCQCLAHMHVMLKDAGSVVL